MSAFAAVSIGDSVKGQENKGQVKDDMRSGKERGRQDAERAKTEAQAHTGNGAPEATASGSTTPGSRGIS
jgi:hypothetical protein